VQPSAPNTQAGIMVRQSNDPAAPYYGVFLTGGSGLVVQYRSAWGGAATTDVQLPTSSVPITLAMQRIGDTFQAASSSDGTNYTLIPGSSATVVMPSKVLAGLAASSAQSGTLATVQYSAVSIGAPTLTFQPFPSATPCPAGWSCQDVGNPALVGDQSLNNGAWSIKGAGQGLGTYNDQFHFVWQPQLGDNTVDAYLPVGQGATAGVMMRTDTRSVAQYYGAFVTPGNQLLIQARTPDDLHLLSITSMPMTAPTYVRVARSGTTFSAYTSADGITWTYVPLSSITLKLPTALLSGVSVTSGAAATLASDSIGSIHVTAGAPIPPTACPTGWNCSEIGHPYPAGEQIFSNGAWTIRGGGGDIWNTTDQFHFVSQPLTGDGSLSAHITSQSNSMDYAKAGVMLRQGTDSNAPYYTAFVTPLHGVLVQYRTAVGVFSSQASQSNITVPIYLKVSRSGTTYTAYSSSDGVTWSLIPGSSVALNMATTLQAGMAVTSHNVDTVSTATFDTVSMSNSTIASCPTGWTCNDIGAATPAGSQSVTGGTWTVQAGGNDIWGTADQFHYAWQTLNADGSVSARVASQSNSSGWAKAGVMLRQSSDAGASYYAVYVTPSNGINVQYRTAAGVAAASKKTIAGVVPQYLKVSKVGTTFTAYTSSDGVTWNVVAGSSVTITMNGAILAGLAATSHNTGNLSTVVFDSVNVSIP
jgi:hypothetical protein